MPSRWKSSRRLLQVHPFNSPEENEADVIEGGLKALGQIFQDPQIKFIVREAKFDPEIIDSLSRSLSDNPAGRECDRLQITKPFSDSRLGNSEL